MQGFWGEGVLHDAHEGVAQWHEEKDDEERAYCLADVKLVHMITKTITKTKTDLYFKQKPRKPFLGLEALSELLCKVLCSCL